MLLGVILALLLPSHWDRFSFHTHSQFAQADSRGVAGFDAGRIKFVFIRCVAPAVLILNARRVCAGSRLRLPRRCAAADPKGFSRSARSKIRCWLRGFFALKFSGQNSFVFFKLTPFQLKVFKVFSFCSV